MKNFWFLISTSLAFFLLRLPSLFEPYWYGDEGIYQVLGMGIREGRLLYQGVWDNKPPLLYFLYALFSSDQFTLRLISLIFGILTVVVFFFLAKKFFKEEKPVYWATGIFAFLFGIPLLEGNIANSENFMLLPILLSGFLIYKVVDRNSENSSFLIHNSLFSILFIAGFLLSFAFLFKIVAIFDFAAFFVFFIIIRSFRLNLFKSAIETLPLILGFILPILVTALYFALNSAFGDFLKASFGQNVGYVGYGNKFIIPQGFLFLKLFLLSSFLFFLYLKKRVISASTIFIFIWLSFSLFNAFFSQRPYTHYLLVLLPSLCLFLGLTFSSVKKRGYLVLLFILIIVLSKNFNVYGKTPFYYQNFISFLTGNKDTYSYLRFFDRNTPKDYRVASFINSHSAKNDQIFIWGNNAQLYKLTNKLPPGRFTVLYHITGEKKYLEETRLDVLKANPKYIIVVSQKNPLYFSLVNYREKITIEGYQIYERIL